MTGFRIFEQSEMLKKLLKNTESTQTSGASPRRSRQQEPIVVPSSSEIVHYNDHAPDQDTQSAPLVIIRSVDRRIDAGLSRLLKRSAKKIASVGNIPDEVAHDLLNM